MEINFIVEKNSLDDEKIVITRNIMFTNSWTQNPENKINYTHE